MSIPQLRRSFQVFASTLAFGAVVIAAIQHDTSLLPRGQTATATPEPTQSSKPMPTMTPPATESPVPRETAVPTPVPASASGEAMPSRDLPGWRLTFSDDFRVNVDAGQFPGVISNTWASYPSTFRDTSGKGRYSSRIISIHDNMMDIHLRTEDGVPLVAAPIPVIPGAPNWNGQSYGRYAVRFRAEPVAGYKTAWLLWPTSETWPGDGEIDFPEGNLDSTISAFMHRQGATAGSDQDQFRTTARYPDWHTAVIEWAPGEVKFFLDGELIGTSTERVPNTPMRWVLQTETTIDGSPTPEDADGHVFIDWVAIWSYAA